MSLGDASLRRGIESDLGEAIASIRELEGGCISQAFACRLVSGREVFVKCKQDCPPDMFAIEARGLAWLGDAQALRVPRVLAASSEHLILEFIARGPPADDYDEKLGRGLATLHRAGAAHFGFAENGYLATLTQDNRPMPTWAEFYSECRLRPLLVRALERQLIPTSWLAKFELLFDQMHSLVADPEAPARLHGDLWSGNLHCDDRGEPALIDPAAYGGHREVDLAMLALFGSPSDEFFAAYNEGWPLQAGYRERFALYQLYPLLAHIHLFGSTYNSQCLRALESYL